eukprot:TRINITY_DN11020_c0_g1_i4.p1 TRINITY_DN11020_c0_g1~~TRINITY_DN11020_c0_g1_i4.p1  ORF type:complete len:405 (+),score=70.32 TRINITY_DN11020_c0_g1_i4:52-1215(+)
MDRSTSLTCIKALTHSAVDLNYMTIAEARKAHKHDSFLTLQAFKNLAVGACKRGYLDKAKAKALYYVDQQGLYVDPITLKGLGDAAVHEGTMTMEQTQALRAQEFPLFIRTRPTDKAGNIYVTIGDGDNLNQEQEEGLYEEIPAASNQLATGMAGRALPDAPAVIKSLNSLSPTGALMSMTAGLTIQEHLAEENKLKRERRKQAEKEARQKEKDDKKRKAELQKQVSERKKDEFSDIVSSPNKKGGLAGMRLRRAKTIDQQATQRPTSLISADSPKASSPRRRVATMTAVEARKRQNAVAARMRAAARASLAMDADEIIVRWKAEPVHTRYRALTDVDGRHDGWLSMLKDDYITVLEEVDNGICVALNVKNSKKGLVRLDKLRPAAE